MGLMAVGDPLPVRHDHCERDAIADQRKNGRPQGGAEHGSADQRHQQEQLERRLGRELDHDSRPVGRREQRPALQEELQIHAFSL